MSAFRGKFPEPEDLQKVFENWWRAVGAIAGTIAAALGSLQIGAPTNYIIAAAVTVVGLTIAIVLFRKDARNRDKAEEDKASSQQVIVGGAFRGLRRFLLGDTLPGIQRRRQAAQLSRQIVNPAFKIALVTGDSGAGKSSMLESAVTKALEEDGHPVAMISNLSRLGLSTASNSSQIEPVITEIADQVSKRRVPQGKSVVLILDQFEEILSRFRNEQDRNALGDGLWKQIVEGTRIIIGIRKEYLVDFKFIASRLESSVSFEDTFLVENFDIKEAAAVILECAGQDHIYSDPDLPALIAEDLAVDERVRPADLQIVCTALSGDLTIDRYKSQGRAAGLRSRFMRGVIDITGDAVLARTVLRQLCDIPNNKKVAEPQRAEEIAEKARAGAPGQRATTAAVTSILRALEQARILIKIDAPEERWSLIHDYLVEPIKLATEEQNTSSEAAAARLDYFITRAKTTGAVIPLSDLRLIRRDAPPAALKQSAARSLIRRSLLIGYGAPSVGALGIALLAISLVVFATTERQWRVVDAKNHWDGISLGQRRSQVSALLTELDSRPHRRTIIVGNFFRDGRLTAWDADEGTRLGVQSGTLINPSIWSYDKESGHLSKRGVTGNEIWGGTIPLEGRPFDVESIAGFNDPYIYFETSFRKYFSVSFNTKSERWIALTDDQVRPTALLGSSNYRYSETKFLKAVSAQSNAMSRITVWTTNYEELVFDEKYDGSIRLLGLTDLGSHTILSFVKDRMVTNITIARAMEEQKGSNPKFSIGEKIEIPLPKGLELRDGEAWQDPPDVIALGKRIIIVDPSAKRTIFWVFNPGAKRFEEPLIGARSAYISDIGYSWMTEEDSEATRFWRKESPEPIRVMGMKIRSKDHIDISTDQRRALVVSKEGNGDLLEMDFTAGKASLLGHIIGQEDSRLFFSSDEQLVMMRRSGGFHEAWDRNGSMLGSLGTLGSEVQASTYQGECRRILIWTGEGQRLDFRRGFNIPLVGFVPERNCTLELSQLQRIIGKMLAYVVR